MPKPSVVAPKILAVFNITNNSFTGDGDLYYSDIPAMELIRQKIIDGASVIDLGAEAMCPGSIAVIPLDEIERLKRVLPDLVKERDKTRPHAFEISIDTRNYETAKWAIEQGADIINDVSALKDDRMKQLAAEHKGIKWVFMHNLGTPPDKNVTLPKNQDPVKIIYAWAEQKIAEFKRMGIEKDRLIFDPGIAFGKTALQALDLVHRAGEFRSLGVPVCYGHSRKTYFTPLEDQSLEARDKVTAGMSHYLATQGVEYLRVHDIKRNHEAIEGKGGNLLPEGWYEDFKRGLNERSRRRAVMLRREQETATPTKRFKDTGDNLVLYNTDIAAKEHHMLITPDMLKDPARLVQLQENTEFSYIQKTDNKADAHKVWTWDELCELTRVLPKEKKITGVVLDKHHKVTHILNWENEGAYNAHQQSVRTRAYRIGNEYFYQEPLPSPLPISQFLAEHKHALPYDLRSKLQRAVKDPGVLQKITDDRTLADMENYLINGNSAGISIIRHGATYRIGVKGNQKNCAERVIDTIQSGLIGSDPEESSQTGFKRVRNTLEISNPTNEIRRIMEEAIEIRREKEKNRSRYT